MSDKREDLIVIPSNFGEARQPVVGAGLGETFAMVCVDCSCVIASGPWDQDLGIGFLLACHAMNCPARSFTLERWQ